MTSAVLVSLPELVDVLDDVASWTRFHYLDRETGAIETALTEAVDTDGHFADIRANPERFVVIQALPGWLRVQVRERFVERGVDDPSLRLDLLDALKAAKPLLEFQKNLRRHPGLLDAFTAFRTEAFGEAAKNWLRENKVSMMPPPRGAAAAEN